MSEEELGRIIRELRESADMFTRSSVTYPPYADSLMQEAADALVEMHAEAERLRCPCLCCGKKRPSLCRDCGQG